MIRVRRVRSTGDQGSALAIALTFLMIFGLLIGSVLQFAATGQRTTVSVRDDATNTYAGGGALDGAINMLSQPANVMQGLGPSGAPCLSFTLPASTPSASALDNASDVVVSCNALPGSGLAGSTTAVITGAAATVASSVTTGASAWTFPALATAAGGGSAATPSFAGNGRESTTLRIGPFTAAPAVPPAATNISVQAALTGTIKRGQLSAVLRTSGASPLQSAAVTFACLSPCTSQPSPPITAAGGAPLTSSSVNGASIDITFTKDTNGTADATIDVVTLIIGYTVPSNPTTRKVFLEAKDAGGAGRTLAKAQVWFASGLDPLLNGLVPTVKQWVVS